MGFPYNTRTAVVPVTTAAYATNQLMGALQSFNIVDTDGFLQSVQINLNSTNATQVDFCMFTSSMPNSTFSNGSSIAISSADFAAQGPVVNVTTWNYMGTTASNGLASGLAYAYPPCSLGIMYWALVARGALTVNSTIGVSVTVTMVS